MKFNEKLVNLRKKEGLSQEELGYRLNVTRQTVSKWELGQTTPEMDKLTEISKIFNVSVDELINESQFTSNQGTVIKDKSLGIKNFKSNKLVLVIVGILLSIALLLSIKAIISSTNDKTTVIEENIVDNSNNIFDKFTSFFDRLLELFDKAIESQEEMLEDSGEFSKTFNTSSFNGKFKIYSGSTLGTSSKRLLDEVITSNQTSEKLITVKYNETVAQSVDEIRNLKTNIDDFSNFEISFEYNEEGYINTVIIERVISKSEIQRFNGSYELFSGSNMGGTVISVLDKIITNNKTNDKKISVTYTGSETLDENEIRNIKNQIDMFDNFDIIYEYDQDGFIYKAIIKKL